MYNIKEILETTRMITENNLDVRTITMGISLRDCAHEDINVCANKIYDKITTTAKDLVKTGETTGSRIRAYQLFINVFLLRRLPW